MDSRCNCFGAAPCCHCLVTSLPWTDHSWMINPGSKWNPCWIAHVKEIINFNTFWATNKVVVCNDIGFQEALKFQSHWKSTVAIFMARITAQSTLLISINSVLTCRLSMGSLSSRSLLWFIQEIKKTLVAYFAVSGYWSGQTRIIVRTWK